MTKSKRIFLLENRNELYHWVFHGGEKRFRKTQREFYYLNPTYYWITRQWVGEYGMIEWANDKHKQNCLRKINNNPVSG